MNTERGLCQCGCGQKTNIAKWTCTEKGWIKGEPKRFINHHNSKKERNPRWTNERIKGRNYYIVKLPDGSYIREHILMAESALGKKLPVGAEVHHGNEDCYDNRPENLVVCPDREYHMFLHIRTNALKACGNVHWRKCRYCKQYDDPKNMTASKRAVRKTFDYYHNECMKEYFGNKSTLGGSDEQTKIPNRRCGLVWRVEGLREMGKVSRLW